MMHEKRVFQVRSYEDLDALVADLYRCSSWTGCTGFLWNGLLFLNDSTGPDGAQEYAVVRERDMLQVESFTVSWMKPERFKELAQEVAKPAWPHTYRVVSNRIEDPVGHRCGLCA